VTTIAGFFLILHGFIHGAVWLSPRPAEEMPFDPCRSWLLGRIGPPVRSLAAGSVVLFVLAGLFLLDGGGSAAATAAVAAGMSLVLVVLTFNRWLSAALAIDVAIALVALA
jgi:hypothetical protein